MSQYICALCDDPSDPVVQLHTNLTNGATAAIGANCLPVGLVGALAVELGTDPQRLYDHIRKFADREAKSAAKAEAEAGTPAVAGEADQPGQPGHTQADADADGAMAEQLAAEQDRAESDVIA